MKHFNDLSPAEAERLALLLEEMGEAQQIIGKILRHGYESSSPDDPAQRANRHLLEPGQVDGHRRAKAPEGAALPPSPDCAPWRSG